MPLSKTFDFFLNDDTGRFFTDSNEAYYWHSRDSRFEIIFESDEHENISRVILVFYDKSRNRCAEELRNWLITANSPEPPSAKLLADVSAKTYEATWSPHGKQLHLEAWVAENTANFTEWEAVLHLYPKK